MIEAIGLYLAVAAAHELLHYLSARKRVVSLSVKPYGIIMRVRSVTLRDVLLPQVITIAMLVAYATTLSPPCLAVGLAHLASSALDFYSYIRFKRVGK